MISDLLAYALLAFIFVVTALRMFLEKPHQSTEIPLATWRRTSLRRREH